MAGDDFGPEASWTPRPTASYRPAVERCQYFEELETSAKIRKYVGQSDRVAPTLQDIIGKRLRQARDLERAKTRVAIRRLSSFTREG